MTEGYERFTRPQRLDRDIHELEGILRGMALDGRIEARESDVLRRWCRSREDVASVSPFNELLPKIAAALEDGVLDEEERADLLWFCERVRVPNAYYDLATSDMQRLHGLLAGVVADGAVDDVELRGVREWIDSVEHLRGVWPYDEIDALVMQMLNRRMIDATDQRFLVAFCREFLSAVPGGAVVEPAIDEDFIRNGVCAACPEIEFGGRRFCITGTSPAGARRQLEDVIAKLGGEPLPRVRRDLNYLVIAAARNASWPTPATVARWKRRSTCGRRASASRSSTRATSGTRPLIVASLARPKREPPDAER